MYRHWHIAVLAGVLASAGALADDSQYGPVGRDTLWTVAGKVNAQKRLGTTAQVAWALYVKNPQAFDGSPGKVKAAAMLVIPDAATVTSITNMDAYARLTGSPADPATPVVAVPASVPVAARASAPVAAPASMPLVAPAALANKLKAAPTVRVDAHALPLITAVELKPARNGTQWFGVVGENFRPGATLELRDMLNGTAFTHQVPARIASSRIDYEARVGQAQSHWLVTVRNADGTISEAYGLAAGPGAVSVGPDPAAAVAAAEVKRAEAEQAAAHEAAAAQEVAAKKAAAEKAAAEKAAAEKAAAEKAAAEAARSEQAEQASHLKREQERLAAEAAAMKKDSGKPVSNAELDREFEEKMAADRAAYEKAEAAKKARAKKK